MEHEDPQRRGDPDGVVGDLCPGQYSPRQGSGTRSWFDPPGSSERGLDGLVYICQNFNIFRKNYERVRAANIAETKSAK